MRRRERERPTEEERAAREPSVDLRAILMMSGSASRARRFPSVIPYVFLHPVEEEGPSCITLDGDPNCNDLQTSVEVAVDGRRTVRCQGLQGVLESNADPEEIFERVGKAAMDTFLRDSNDVSILSLGNDRASRRAILLGK